ncbi:uncharacterized protein LOC130657897 [Hydractinia symbiolongicarpus]|uniref:uncharacterized protein LOC130657897 n=1 Tax=Hydractinia symbiolongicarpus TaxID=13093 RepID=UPI00254B0DCE|nr:uncharacterized protein LOC130657897 [Hydractinia symbiolongicarpus]
MSLSNLHLFMLLVRMLLESQALRNCEAFDWLGDILVRSRKYLQMVMKNTDESLLVISEGKDLSNNKKELHKTKKTKKTFSLVTFKKKKTSPAPNEDENTEKNGAKDAEASTKKILDKKPPVQIKDKPTTDNKKQWNILTKKPIAGKKTKSSSKSHPVKAQTKQKKIKRTGKTKTSENIECDKKNETSPKELQRKDSIAKMASLLDESEILPVEKQSGLFEEIKDSPDAHKIIGGRSVFKHRDSLNLYKDGYEPGHSGLLEGNATKKKSRNTGFHLSLNESTVSFLGTSPGFLEMSSGLVVNKKKPDHGFHISLDDISDISQSGVFIKNKIFDKNNQWDIAETTPGRKENTTTENRDILNNQTCSTLPLPQTEEDFYEGSPLTSSRRNSTRLSFLYNAHTGFICKHCFTSDCHHVEKSDNKQPVHENSKQNDLIGNDISVETCKDKQNAMDEVDEGTLDDTEVEILLENLRQKLDKNLSNAIEIKDLVKLIKLRQVYHADDDGRMVPYNELIIDVDNTVLQNDTNGGDSVLEHTEDELLTLRNQEEKNNVVTTNDSAEKGLDLSESALRMTPVVPQEKVPISTHQPYKQISHDSSKETFYYDSDYDDASYLNACALSKTNGSFEKLEVASDILYSNTEHDSDVPMTPPLNASSPTHPPLESSGLKLSKRRTSLRPLSELEPVPETEEVQQFTSRSANSAHSNALTHVTTDINVLDELIDFANDKLETNKIKSDEEPDYKNGDGDQYEDSLNSFALPVNIDGNTNQGEENQKKLSYSDLTLSELKALTHKHKTLNSLTKEENHSSKKELSEDIVDSHDTFEKLENQHGFYGDNQLEVWLQDVRKQCLDQLREEERQRLGEEGENITNENEVIQDENNNQNSNPRSSDSNANSGISSNVNPAEASYHHIDVLVLDNGRADPAPVASPGPSTATTTKDSGVQSHVTDLNYPTGVESSQEPSDNEREVELEPQPQDQSSMLVQRLNMSHEKVHDYRSMNFPYMISNMHSFSYFDHPANITEPMDDYHTYLAKHNRNLRNFVAGNQTNLASQPSVNAYQPRPPQTQNRSSPKANHRNTVRQITYNNVSSNSSYAFTELHIPRPPSVTRLPRVNQRPYSYTGLNGEMLTYPYPSEPLPYLTHSRHITRYNPNFVPSRQSMTQRTSPAVNFLITTMIHIFSTFLAVYKYTQMDILMEKNSTTIAD